MSKHDRSARSGRTSLYDEITGKIIAELEAGRVPWSSPGAPRQQSAARDAEELPLAEAISGINVC